MKWVTSDHHFGHTNILRFQKDTRPFSSIEEHDEFAIEQWNSQVKQEDDVYYLGDFTLRDWEFASSIIKRLNGQIHFIFGGHDHRWYYEASDEELLELGCTRLGELTTIYSKEHSLDGKHPLPIVLCHYAMKTFDRSHYGSIQLFGHSHGNLKNPEKNTMDVGVDNNNFKLYSLEEVVEILGSKEQDG